MKSLHTELVKFNKNRKQIIKDNTVKDDFPTIKRTYTYRNSTIVTPRDLNL